MTKLYYPVALKLKNKRILVTGGGRIAERKVKTLLKFGAFVKVVSPDLTSALRKLARAGRISWRNRKVKTSDVKGAYIVIAATSDADINKKISLWSKKKKALVNVVDRSNLSDFISPAVFAASRAVIAVYTDGKDPELSRDLKNFIKENWDVFLSYRNRLRKSTD